MAGSHGTSAAGARGRILIAASGVVGAAIAVLLTLRFTRDSMSACEREVRYGDRSQGVAICLASYDRTGSERDLSWAARAYLYLGKIDDAETVARRLLAGSRGGDAHGILGYIALRRGALPEARMHARLARDAHTLSGDQSGLAADALLLSRAARDSGDFRGALDAADDALRLVKPLDDSHTEANAYIARADALRKIGDPGGAAATLAVALGRATEPCDRTWIRLKNGMCLVDAGLDGPAMVELGAAAQANRRCGSHDVALQIATNEAWLLRAKDPAGALARLDELAKSEDDGVDNLLLRGYLAADRGALAEADRYLTHAAKTDPADSRADADWQWDIVCAQAELAEQRGGILGPWRAEYLYRRATAMVAALRIRARDRSAYLVSRHRRPYDGLIALLARGGRWRDVLAVVLELDASDMLRATAAATSGGPSSEVEMLAERTIAPAPPSVDGVLSAWRSRDLVIVIAQSERQIGSGGERVLRLRLSHGQLTGEDVGDAKAAQSWSAALFADPGDRVAARALGRMLVPPGSSDATLHVLAIGPLGKVPLAALRDDHDALIIGKRPLVRVLGLRATRPEAVGVGPSTVIADPRGDLGSAAVEGAVVAAALGPGAQLSGSGTSSPATRARLWAARDAGLLHVAAHIGALGRWRTLLMADGEVEPAELVQRGIAPRIAVLAGCGSAAATDEEGWGSIAAALLESGTAVVIATDRSVRDQASLSLMRDFYAQPDWRIDPARALARVQHALDAHAAGSGDPATSARTWAAFSVLARPPVVADETAKLP